MAERMGEKWLDFALALVVRAPWIPAFAGMTELCKGLQRDTELCKGLQRDTELCRGL